MEQNLQHILVAIALTGAVMLIFQAFVVHHEVNRERRRQERIWSRRLDNAALEINARDRAIHDLHQELVETHFSLEVARPANPVVEYIARHGPLSISELTAQFGVDVSTKLPELMESQEVTCNKRG